MLPGADRLSVPSHTSSMKRLAAATGVFVVLVFAPVAEATVTNASPAAGVTVPSGAPVTFSWTTNNVISPVFGGRVNVVLTRNGVTVLDRSLYCPSGGTSTCPTETVVDTDELPPGTYEWYVRWWIFVNGPPNEIWDASTPTGFTVVAVPPSGPPTPPGPPPLPDPPQPPPPTASDPTAPGLQLDGSKSIRLSLAGRFAEAWTTVTVDRAATVALTVTHPRTGAPLRLSAGSQVGPTISGRPHLVLKRSATGSARLVVRIRLQVAALRRGRTYVAQISATNEVGTREVSLTIRR